MGKKCFFSNSNRQTNTATRFELAWTAAEALNRMKKRKKKKKTLQQGIPLTLPSRMYRAARTMRYRTWSYFTAPSQSKVTNECRQFLSPAMPVWVGGWSQDALSCWAKHVAPSVGDRNAFGRGEGGIDIEGGHKKTVRWRGRNATIVVWFCSCIIINGHWKRRDETLSTELPADDGWNVAIQDVLPSNMCYISSYRWRLTGPLTAPFQRLKRGFRLFTLNHPSRTIQRREIQRTRSSPKLCRLTSKSRVLSNRLSSFFVFCLP